MKRMSLLHRGAAVMLALLVCFQLPAGARQQPAGEAYSPQLRADLRRLIQAALASDYAYRQTAYLCNNIGPRLSGSPQAAAAVQYVAEEMRRLGLDVRLEKVMVPHWVRGDESGELVAWPGQPAGTTRQLALLTLGGSVATPPEGLTAEVVVVENYAQLEALGRDRVAGRIVLYNARFDQRLAENGMAGEAYGQAVIYRGGGASRAARLGAVAALVRSVGGAAYRLPHTGAMSYQPDAPKIPAAAVSSEDADMIAALAAQGPVRVRLRLTPETRPDAESYNVIADLKGSENPEQVVLVSGHLDSWDVGTGAHDDAVGVAVAMQVANLVKQLGLKPKRTIRVVAWMNEENGLRGGMTYRANQQNELANHVAAIEMDMGAGHAMGILAHVSDAALARLRPLSGALAEIGAGVIRQVNRSVGADISPLEAAGVPGFAPLNDTRTYFDYHHTQADTFDKVDPRHLAENAAVLAALAYALASLPEPLPR